MRELERQYQDENKDQIESEHLEREKIEFKFQHSIRPRKGHTVWEINLKTKEISHAKYKETDIIDFHEAQKKTGKNIKDIVRNPGFIYISALNQKNALKRLEENKGHANMPNGWLNL